MQEDEHECDPDHHDVPADVKAAAGDALAGADDGKGHGTGTAAGSGPGGRKSLSHVAGGAIFREVVLAKVRDAKEHETALKVEREAQEKEAKRRSWQEDR